MVIPIDKVTQILKILYPDRIEPEDFFEVYENVIPKIQKLISGVDLGYHTTKLIEREHVDAVVDTSWMRDRSEIGIEKSIDVGAEHPKKTESDKDDKNNNAVKNLASFEYVEDQKYIVDDTWTENQYNDCQDFKKGELLVIKGESSRVDTTWTYLCDFFNSLPDEIAITHIEGLNKKKLQTLTRFYEAHPNFTCHIEKVAGSNILFKEEIRVGTVINGHNDTGTVDPDTYGAL